MPNRRPQDKVRRVLGADDAKLQGAMFCAGGGAPEQLHRGPPSSLTASGR